MSRNVKLQTKHELFKNIGIGAFTIVIILPRSAILRIWEIWQCKIWLEIVNHVLFLSIANLSKKDLAIQTSGAFAFTQDSETLDLI